MFTKYVYTKYLEVERGRTMYTKIKIWLECRNAHERFLNTIFTMTSYYSGTPERLKISTTTDHAQI